MARHLSNTDTHDGKPVARATRRNIRRSLAIGAAASLTLAAICVLATQPRALPTPQEANARLLGAPITAEEAVVDDTAKPEREADRTQTELEATSDPSNPSGGTAVPQEAQDAVQVPVQKDTQAEEAPSADASAAQAPESAPAPAPQESAEDETATEAAPYTGPRLTREGGVNTFDGHTETWYSQRVLPGTGLDIPGRHVADDGTIRDADDYIVVASDDLPKGSLVETSLGTGKVYDTFGGYNEGTGNVDIYTDW